MGTGKPMHPGRGEAAARSTASNGVMNYLFHHWQLYLMLAVPVAYVLLFAYLPMVGLEMAFVDYRPSRGLFGSEFVGLRHFLRFFRSPSFLTLVGNTFLLSFYSLVFSFPFPILLALGLNEIRNGTVKRAMQTVTYAPYFISTVVMVSLVFQWTDMRIGIVNLAISFLGGTPRNFMGEQGSFRGLYVLSGIWQFTGFNSIIYLATLSSIDPQLHEAAIVDGASRLRRVWHIDLPGILPTIVILLILNCGRLLSVGFEKVFLMQTPLNTAVSEIISTYVYKIGIQQRSFSFAVAVGLFNSLVNLILIASVNALARRTGETSLW